MAVIYDIYDVEKDEGVYIGIFYSLNINKSYL